MSSVLILSITYLFISLSRQKKAKSDLSSKMSMPFILSAAVVSSVSCVLFRGRGLQHSIFIVYMY